MTGLLRGKTAVVTGGSSGIGRAISIAFANEGAFVVVADQTDVPREGGVPTHELIVASGGRAVFHHCDVTKQGDLEAAIDTATKDASLDIFVNNAGIMKPGPFLDYAESDFDLTIAVNVKAPFMAAKGAAQRMAATGGGSIINVSSIAGLRGVSGLVAYSASKGAVRLMSHAMAAELAQYGIRVNALHPGLIDTAINRIDVPVLDSEGAVDPSLLAAPIPLGPPGTPAQVASAAVFLASDMSSYMTGTSTTVDGGMSCS